MFVSGWPVLFHFCALYNSFEFFISAIAEGLSLESEWEPVSSGVQNSSLYSGRSQQCCSLDGYYYYQSFKSFSHQRLLMGFFWSLSDSKSSEISRTLRIIASDRENISAWMVSPCTFISKSSSPFTNPKDIIQSASITIGIAYIIYIRRVLGRKNAQTTARNIHILFPEQAVCRRGTKIENGLLYTCVQYHLVALPLPGRVQDRSLHLKEQRQKRLRRVFWNCLVIHHERLNRHI